MAGFEIPDFLNEDADAVHERMLSKAPSDVNTIEGDFFWNNTRPTAEELASLKQVTLNTILKAAFPQTSFDNYLDYLGELKGLPRNLATFSTGKIKVIALPGTQINQGYMACANATEDNESIEFEFQETKVVDETGIAYINAKCTTTGTIGNVSAGSITVLTPPINGVQNIINEAQFTGGTEIEDDTHYRSRIIAAEQEENLSGADDDYKKWAKKINGVGYVDVNQNWNGPGTVKVLILDKNGKTATQELIDAVQNYIAPIVPPGQNRGGVAPVGAIVTVSTPDILNLSIKADFIFTNGYSDNLVLNDIKNEINDYVSNIALDDTLSFKAIDSIIGSFIVKNKGLDDYSNLTINEGTQNVKLNEQVVVVNEVVPNAIP